MLALLRIEPQALTVDLIPFYSVVICALLYSFYRDHDTLVTVPFTMEPRPLLIGLLRSFMPPT